MDLPKSFLDFQLIIPTLVINRKCKTDSVCALSTIEAKGMNPKKRHEVAALSSYVDAQCTKSKCGHVVDVGSGLVRNFLLT